MSAPDSDKTQAAQAQAVRDEVARTNERWPMYLEIYALEAKIARAKYLAYVRAGFTEQQALALCRSAPA